MTAMWPKLDVSQQVTYATLIPKIEDSFGLNSRRLFWEQTPQFQLEVAVVDEEGTKRK